MKALPLKTVQITFDYRTRQDLFKLLETIRIDLFNEQFNRSGFLAGLKYDVKTTFKNTEKQEPTIQIINGQTYEVYQSKMNKK